MLNVACANRQSLLGAMAVLLFAASPGAAQVVDDPAHAALVGEGAGWGPAPPRAVRQRRNVPPPPIGPCFGYAQTTWSRWPEACSQRPGLPPAAATVEEVQAVPSAPADPGLQLRPSGPPRPAVIPDPAPPSLPPAPASPAPAPGPAAPGAGLLPPAVPPTIVQPKPVSTSTAMPSVSQPSVPSAPAGVEVPLLPPASPSVPALEEPAAAPVPRANPLPVHPSKNAELAIPPAANPQATDPALVPAPPASPPLLDFAPEPRSSANPLPTNSAPMIAPPDRSLPLDPEPVSFAPLHSESARQAAPATRQPSAAAYGGSPRMASVAPPPPARPQLVSQQLPARRQAANSSPSSRTEQDSPATSEPELARPLPPSSRKRPVQQPVRRDADESAPDPAPTEDLPWSDTSRLVDIPSRASGPAPKPGTKLRQPVTMSVLDEVELDWKPPEPWVKPPASPQVVFPKPGSKSTVRSERKLQQTPAPPAPAEPALEPIPMQNTPPSPEMVPGESPAAESANLPTRTARPSSRRVIRQ